MSLEASLLVVDDSEANRDMLSRRLRGKGYAVIAFAWPWSPFATAITDGPISGTSA